MIDFSTLDIPTLEENVSIPGPLSVDFERRIRGEGLPLSENSKERGDLIIKFKYNKRTKQQMLEDKKEYF